MPWKATVAVRPIVSDDELCFYFYFEGEVIDTD